MNGPMRPIVERWAMRTAPPAKRENSSENIEKLAPLWIARPNGKSWNFGQHHTTPRYTTLFWGPPFTYWDFRWWRNLCRFVNANIFFVCRRLKKATEAGGPFAYCAVSPGRDRSGLEWHYPTILLSYPTIRHLHHHNTICQNYPVSPVVQNPWAWPVWSYVLLML